MAKLINATKSLCPQSIKDFKENHNDDAIIVMYIEGHDVLFEKPLSELRKFFEDTNIEQIITSDDCIIYFMYRDSDDVILQIAGIDYKWWIAPYRRKVYGRLKILFDENIETKTNETQKQIKVENVHKCVVAKKVNDNIEIIDRFEGKLKDVITFVNKSRTVDTLRTFFKSDALYAFDEDIDKANFKTYEELVKEGVFVL